ncbi:MAG: glutamate-5-semialdehyde dehydrogenase [Acidiferrobacteraceae bacterium]|nr:glutamate-5-semialdehyde dehydrogenase [Acidiferrobacteraceae bacterium]
MITMGRSARSAAKNLAIASTSQKNNALRAIANELRESSKTILRENAIDIDCGNKQELSIPLLDRLQLTAERIDLMADGINRVAELFDPVGEISDLKRQESGIEVGRMRVPLGVIGIIFESRPNVTADAAALCIKSGNAAILRGGSEALRSNLAIADCIQRGLSDTGLPKDSVQVVQVADRAVVGELLQLKDYVDVIVPRGGRELIERVVDESKIPVLRHLDGNCHVYIEKSANIDKAVAIAYNAKCRRYGICGAMETLLLSKEIAEVILKKLIPLYHSAGVELRVCPESKKLIPQARDATEQDWYREYLAPILAVRVVDNLDHALDHIERYGSGHTDSIVTEDLSVSRRFLREVDSSSVMVNASTQFADGFEYGLGAEIGISTEKIHARGPVGLDGLTTQKFIVIGDGSVRA